MKKLHEELFDKAIFFCKKQNYKESIIYFTKAENASPDGKYPSASQHKGMSFVLLKDYENALIYFTKAEKDSINEIYPGASFCRGISFYAIGKYKKALDSLTKAEYDSMNGKHPEASLNKGFIFDEIEDLKNALISYTKAEKDSIDERCPKASQNKGLILYQFGDNENALISFTKAENDSLDRKNSEASFSKGKIFQEQKKYNNAILSYTKAENDGLNGKFPGASLNKGLIFQNFQNYKAALASYTKAENDGLNGKFPNASINKSSVYYTQGNYRKAIISLTKAEYDSPNEKKPLASLNKGRILNFLSEFNLAIISLDKAIKDSKKKIPLAYLERSKSKLSLNKKESATKDAFTAISQNSRLEKVISNIEERFSKLNTKKFYTKRLEYLSIGLGVESSKNIDFSDLNLNPYLREENFSNANYFLFVCLEKKIKFKVAITFLERLRLAYLISYKLENYGSTFYIIDEFIDEEYPMSDMDIFFYFLSAYLIGEPVSELTYYSTLKVNNESSQFGILYKNLSDKIQTSISDRSYLDPYILDIQLSQLSKDVLNEKHHLYIHETLKSIIENTTYEIPISENELKGLTNRVFIEIKKTYLNDDIINNKNWERFQSFIFTNKHNANQIENIKDCIDDKVPYELILNELFAEYDSSDDPNQLHNIAILQAATILYSNSKNSYTDFIASNDKQKIIGSLGGLLANESLGMMIALGLIAKFGFSLAVSFIIGKSIKTYKDKSQLNKKIEELKEELIN